MEFTDSAPTSTVGGKLRSPTVLKRPVAQVKPIICQIDLSKLKRIPRIENNRLLTPALGSNGRSTTPTTKDVSPRNNKHHSPADGYGGDQKAGAVQRLNYGADGSGRMIKREIKNEYGDYGNNLGGAEKKVKQEEGDDVEKKKKADEEGKEQQKGSADSVAGTNKEQHNNKAISSSTPSAFATSCSSSTSSSSATPSATALGPTITANGNGGSALTSATGAVAGSNNTNNMNHKDNTNQTDTQEAKGMNSGNLKDTILKIPMTSRGGFSRKLNIPKLEGSVVDFINKEVISLRNIFSNIMSLRWKND